MPRAPVNIHKLNDATGSPNKEVRGDAQFRNLSEERVRRRVKPIREQGLHRAAAEASRRQRDVVDHEKIHRISAAAFIRIRRLTVPRAFVPTVLRAMPACSSTLDASRDVHFMPKRCSR